MAHLTGSKATCRGRQRFELLPAFHLALAQNTSCELAWRGKHFVSVVFDSLLHRKLFASRMPVLLNLKTQRHPEVVVLACHCRSLTDFDYNCRSNPNGAQQSNTISGATLDTFSFHTIVRAIFAWGENLGASLERPWTPCAPFLIHKLLVFSLLSLFSTYCLRSSVLAPSRRDQESSQAGSLHPS